MSMISRSLVAALSPEQLALMRFLPARDRDAALDKFLGAVKRGRERLHERSQETVVAGVGAPGSDNEEPPY